MFPDSTCIYFSHLQHQKSRIQRKLFFQSSPQDPHVACFVLLSGDESCPVRAKTHHSGSQSLVCSHPSRGRNQASRPVSSGTLPTPHRLVTVHIEGTCVVGVDGIDTAFLITSFVEFGTILVNFKDMINICIAFFQPLFFDILSRFALLGCSPPILLLPRVLTTVVGRLKRGKDENSPCPYYYFFHYFYFHINTPVPDPDVGGLQKCFQPFGPQSVL